MKYLYLIYFLKFYKLQIVGFIWKVYYLEWLANVIMVKKVKSKQIMYVDDWTVPISVISERGICQVILKNQKI